MTDDLAPRASQFAAYREQTQQDVGYVLGDLTSLGWLILAEPVTARTFLAMALILGAVVWIQFSHTIGRLGGRADGRKETAAVQQEAS